VGRIDAASPWRRLCGLDAYRIIEIPRRPEGETTGKPGARERDLGRLQRLAALVAAYHAGGVVAFGWMRRRVGGPVHILAAGSALAGSTAGGDVVLALPGGARGQVLPLGALARSMSELSCWRAIGGISDGLLVAARDAPPDRDHAVPSLEECLLPAWTGPFGWLAVAEPVGSAELHGLADEVARRERLASGMAERFPERDVEARRLRHRHAELRQALSTGLWQVHLLAGGADQAAAARVAGLLCASADLNGLPYTLSPARGAATGLRDLLDGAPPDTAAGAPADSSPAAAPGESTGGNYPFHASTELLAALARAPESEVPGVRVALRPDFDVTPETAAIGPGQPAVTVGPAAPSTVGPAATGDVPHRDEVRYEAPGGITLGEVLDRQRMPAGTLRFPLESLNRHVFVCGATGGGKSQTVRGLLEAATRAGVPWLVVEPAKAEYRLMTARLAGLGAEVVRIRPGEADAIAAGLNPLEPAADAAGHRFPLQTHADLVRALFLAAFESEEPFPQVLSAALTRVYEDAGWDLALGEPVTEDVAPGYPSLTDLQRAAEKVILEIGYGERLTADVLGFIKVRLSSLRLGMTGRFLEGGHPVDVGKLLRRNAVLEIEDVGDDRDKAFLMGTVLIRLVEYLRLASRHERGAASGLRHLTVFEEAHRLLRRPDAASGAVAHAVELFAGLLAEIRAYGEGVVIAEQIPAKLIPDVIKNTAVKITHRLPAADDREAVGATMNMTRAQSQYLVTLVPGEAAVFMDGMDYPLLVKMPDGTAREAAAGGAVGTATPAGVVSVRSTTCGAECVARPCTLRDMRAAQRAPERYPGIALWAELAVLSHLTGWAMPVPKAALLDLLRVMPVRLRDCALSHGVDAAVAARTPVISSRVSPVGLASHVSTAIRARVTRGMWMCQKEEPRWLAPAYQWALVLDSLKSADRKSPGPGPHRRTGEWERAYGQAIIGDTCARQAGTVQRWYDNSQRDAGAVRAVAFGVSTPSAIERAIGASTEDDDFEQHLNGYLEQFIDCRWPLLYLTGTTPGHATPKP
jgi:DNA helicase HerA-like ATPase